MGLGYIGLPTAIIAAKHGWRSPADINAQVVEITKPRGKFAYHRAGYEDMLPGGTGLRTFQGVHRAPGERRLFHGGTHSPSKGIMSRTYRSLSRLPVWCFLC